MVWRPKGWEDRKDDESGNHRHECNLAEGMWREGVEWGADAIIKALLYKGMWDRERGGTFIFIPDEKNKSDNRPAE